ncbi:MAG: TetR/AcrR family transcriptional regulator [Pseudolabrys sp.]
MSDGSKLKPRRRVSPPARELILKAATEAFVAHGYAGASIDQIAAQAGVSKPTIYSHFEGKEALFVAIMNSVCDNFEEPFLAPHANQEDLPTILNRVADNYTRSILQPGVVAMHRLFVAEAERFPELSRRYYEVGPQRVHKTLAGFFTNRMARGEIRTMDAVMLAQFFAALVIAPMRTRCLFAVETDIDWEALDRQNREAILLFLNGCGER